MSLQNFSPKCVIKMSNQNVSSINFIKKASSECFIQMSHQNVLSKCLIKMSHQNASSKCSSECFIKMSNWKGSSKCVTKITHNRAQRESIRSQTIHSKGTAYYINKYQTFPAKYGTICHFKRIFVNSREKAYNIV